MKWESNEEKKYCKRRIKKKIEYKSVKSKPAQNFYQQYLVFFPHPTFHLSIAERILMSEMATKRNTERIVRGKNREKSHSHSPLPEKEDRGKNEPIEKISKYRINQRSYNNSQYSAILWQWYCEWMLNGNICDMCVVITIRDSVSAWHRYIYTHNIFWPIAQTIEKERTRGRECKNFDLDIRVVRGGCKRERT